MRIIGNKASKTAFIFILYNRTSFPGNLEVEMAFLFNE
jgi:hypothetical protein